MARGSGHPEGVLGGNGEVSEILAYCGYVGVTLFYPLQLYSAFTRRNLNLGLWPMISLVIGLALLGASFWMTGILAYKLGNSIGLTCAIVLLALKVREHGSHFVQPSKDS